jgi:hypothetical protein
MTTVGVLAALAAVGSPIVMMPAAAATTLARCSSTRREMPTDFRWCPQWWAHAEPLSRQTGLWRAWESATTNPDQVNQWWLEHCDPHLKAITASNGPFGSCSQTKGHQGDAAGLTVAPMPEGWLTHG